MSKESYIVITFRNLTDGNTDIVMALLADVGFEGFEEMDDLLKAYISQNDYDEGQVNGIADAYSLLWNTEEVPPQNWNAVWESNFEPVVIDDFVAVRAHFHEKIPFVQHEIIITPKMSFGTGHHATTTMMIQQMRNLDFTGKRVLDFGTGTGILSILADRLGAVEVVAIDNDEWSIENSKENIGRNGCNHVRIELMDNADVNESFDIILANINRNVIMDNISFLSSQLNSGGYLLLSGLLAEDEEVIFTKVTHYQFLHLRTMHRLQWISLLFSR